MFDGLKLYEGKMNLEKRDRAIMLAMRNATPRSFYVCEEVDLPHRITFAASINCVDLQIITPKTARALILTRNPSYRFQLDPFQISYPRGAKLECVDCAPSPAEPMNETSNPGGSA